MIAVVLIKGRFFRELYPDVPPGVHLDVLGHLMWIRTGAAAVLLIRGRAEDIGYGFIPTSAECRIGVRQFMTALPFTLAAGYAVGIMSLGSPAKSLAMVPLLTLGTFVGTYFVVALSEEFLLRGILLRRMIDLTDSIPVACVVTAVVSGAVHLSFRTAWNWKFAIVAGVAHWFYGQAYLEGRGIRAGMVAHSLLVTTWVMAFAKSA
jgi:membrane protease YdiL (CAAX protease family)